MLDRRRRRFLDISALVVCIIIVAGIYFGLRALEGGPGVPGIGEGSKNPVKPTEASVPSPVPPASATRFDGDAVAKGLLNVLLSDGIDAANVWVAQVETMTRCDLYGVARVVNGDTGRAGREYIAEKVAEMDALGIDHGRAKGVLVLSDGSTRRLVVVAGLKCAEGV